MYKGLAPLRVHAASSAYTVIRTEKGFDKSGNLRYTNEYLDAVRSDGAVVWKVATPVEHQRRIALPHGEGTLINELIGKKSTYLRRFPGLRVKRDPNMNCSSEADAKIGFVLEGTDTIAGYRTFRYGQVSQEGAWTNWYAPEVGCALVQIRLEHAEGTTVQQLASLTLGEPDPALFEVSSSLVETPPSGLYVPKCLNGRCDTISGSVKARLDNRYYESRSQDPR